ncbi:MAG: hypothetical protein EHM41_00270 [Chloroflexi bacterium]|nr:MAG: hypothetical protein EHM41_00270 [Chloroflexota bacterium]
MHDLETLKRLNEEAGKTPEQIQEIRGNILAENLGLTRAPGYRDRWDLPSGNKTGLGLYRFIMDWAAAAKV